MVISVKLFFIFYQKKKKKHIFKSMEIWSENMETGNHLTASFFFQKKKKGQRIILFFEKLWFDILIYKSNMYVNKF